MAKKLIEIDQDLKDLIPGYIQNRHKELEELNSLLADGDFEAIRSIGHKLKGNAGGYGLDELSLIGADIEKFAELTQKSELAQAFQKIETYLEEIEIVFVDCA